MNPDDNLGAVLVRNDELWKNIASFLPRKFPAEVKSLRDGLVSPGSNPSGSQRTEVGSMRKGVSLSEEGILEERLKKFGKGQRMDISKPCAESRTPTKLSSNGHSQKYVLGPRNDVRRGHQKSSKVAASRPPRRGRKPPVYASDHLTGKQNEPSFSSLRPGQSDTQVDGRALVPDPSQHQSDKSDQKADREDLPSNPGGYFDQKQDSSISSAQIPASSNQEAPSMGIDHTPGQPRQQNQGMDFDHTKTNEDLERELFDYLSFLPDICEL